MSIVWEPTNGPYGGMVNILKIINNEIYAGTHCGIYSSTDNGVTWKNRCPGLGSCKSVIDIELINTTLIAGTAEDGIFISNDFGNNWTQSNSGLNDPFVDYKIFDIVVAGSNILIGTVNGVYKSTNQALTWSPSNIGINESANVNAIRFAKNGTNLFLATGEDIYKSTDNGFTWLDLNTIFGGNGYSFSFVSLGGALYIIDLNQGIYKSVDNGTSWNLLNDNLPSIPVKLFVDGNNLYCSLDDSTTPATYKSTNGGVTWSEITNHSFETLTSSNTKILGGNNDGVYSWLSSNGLASLTNAGLGGSANTNVIFHDGNTMFSGNDNGIYRSTDNGQNWINIGTNLPLNTIVNCMTKSSNTLIIGTKGNGVFTSIDNGNTWSQANSGLTLNGINYSDITSLFHHNGRIFMGAKEKALFYNYATLFVSDNNGIVWTQSATGLAPISWVSSISNFGQYIIAGVFNQGVYLSNDNGVNWFFDGLSGAVNSVCSNISGYYAADANAVYYTTDYGNSWTNVLDPFDPITSIYYLHGNIYSLKENGIYLINGTTLQGVNTAGLGLYGGKGMSANLSGDIFIGSSAIVPYGAEWYEPLNGVSKYVGATLGVTENMQTHLSIFPNPTTGTIRIQFDQKSNDRPYQIHDQYGRLVQSGILSGQQNEIHITEGAGLYFLKTENEVTKVQVLN